MIEKLVVAVIVAAAALWLLRRFVPTRLLARLGLAPARGCTGASGDRASVCGKGDCGGCH